MLKFSGKKTIEEILLETFNGSGDDLKVDIRNSSYLFFGDNKEALKLLISSCREQIDLVYIDPPFNTNQIFAVSEGRVSTISREKTGTVAYSDLMSKDEFLAFMYERFVLIHELLSEVGSLYVHIDTKMGHYFKVMLDEIFGEENFKNDITRIKSNPKNFSRSAYGNQKDMILFYAKNGAKNIWNEIRILVPEEDIKKKFPKIDKEGRRYTTIPLHAPGETNGVTGGLWHGIYPPKGRHWRTDPKELDRMDQLGLIEWSSKGNPRIKKFADEHKGMKIQDVWTFKDPQYPAYPTEKNLDMLSLIIKQSSHPSSVVLDCFSGSGTTLLAASLEGRKFIGVDQSKVSIKTIQKKLEDFIYEFVPLKNNTL